MKLEVYREITTVIVVASADNLSVDRLRSYLQRVVPNWERSGAASFIFHDPDQWESKSAISENKLADAAATLGCDIAEMVRRASAHWSEHDAKMAARLG